MRPIECSLARPLIVAWLVSPHSTSAAIPVTDIQMDLAHIHKWDNSNGDTWDPFWADDDSCMHSIAMAAASARNHGTWPSIASPATAAPAQGPSSTAWTLTAESSEKEPDGANLESLGQECIDGTFYAFVSRHTYGYESHDPFCGRPPSTPA